MDLIAETLVTDNQCQVVAGLVPLLQSWAAERDAEATFPLEEIAALRDAGVLSLPLPVEHGGDPLLADLEASTLIHVGLGNLSVGRLFEAHVNARHLIARYGSPDQRDACARDARDGHLFALWVTDPPEGGLRMRATPDGIELVGRKMFCSGAGHATRALVTAHNESGEAQMLVVALGTGEQAEPLGSPLQGMRAAVTGAVDFTGVFASRSACLGRPGDYLRDPDFSAGAWRGSAVALGGLCGLLDLAKSQLQTTGRLTSPHQQERLGRAMIACETSRLWVDKAARIAESCSADSGLMVAYVGLTRIAVETACLDTMRLLQRSLGLSAFRQGNPVERICRDLATYLRQPAPDEVLTEAATWFAQQANREWP
jgi:alkylation response protein AidB-like acyl-CoA dehydrogenase